MSNYNKVPTKDDGENKTIEIPYRSFSSKNVKDSDNESIYIETIRKATTSKINIADLTQIDLANSNAVDAIRKLSAGRMNLPKYDDDGNRIVETLHVDRKISNAEVGLIEAVRKVSGLHAAMHELGATVGDTDPKAAAESKVLGAEKDWHLYSQDELFKILGTNLNGLTTQEHAKRIEEYGPNLLTPPKQTPFIVKCFLVLVGGFQIMMWFGSVLCFIVFGLTQAEDVQTLALGIVLVAVVLVTSAFQIYQEGKADSVVAALKALTANTVFVFRDGSLQQVNADTLVPGDIVKVTGGEKVPADIRVLSSSDLKVNNSSLTGENVDIKLGPDANHKELFEAKNIARSGCNFTSGNGIAVVFATGDRTFFGSIASAATATERPDTLMKHEIHRLINIMAVVAFTLGIAFFILAFFNGYSWLEAIIFMIGIIVANVPEGLLPQLTVALTLTAQRMLKLGVLVTNLEIIETLGAVDIICSDKTGTLTCNRMTVSHVAYGGKITVTPITPNMEGDDFQNFDPNDPTFKALQRIASLNTDAVFLPSSDSEPDVLKKETKGDASESAIIKFVEPLRSITEYRSKCKRICSIPFNSSNKWMLSINETEEAGSGSGGETAGEGPYILMVKGAPERVMNMCSHVLIDGKAVEFDEKVRIEWDGINEKLARRGERVLAFAHLPLPKDKYPKGFAFDAEAETPNFPIKDLVLVGFLSLIDPPRMSVKPAIAQCNTAGIKVFMVTGDHPITAHAIAKSLSLITKPTAAELEFDGLPVPDDYHEAIVIHGSEMLEFTEADWTRVLRHKEIVFARTMPQQKQDIVRELNKLGNIVAMTGDGVNDSPALKAANVGIAMGSGAAVAKEAGQIILLNDDFGAIVDGIREGRLIFENMKKCIAYVLSSNVPEIVPFLLFIAMKIPLGIETICILLIDLGTDLAPAIALAYEEPEDAIMQVPPRSEHAHLVGPQMMIVAYGTIGIFQTVAAFFAYYIAFARYGFDFSSLIGAGLEYRADYDQLDDSRQSFFDKMCRNNDEYDKMCPDDSMANDLREHLGQEFRDYRIEAFAAAQTAFLMTVVWSQIANILIRKTQVASILTKERLFGNKVLIYSILFEVCVIVLLTYCPGLNAVFMLRRPDPVACSSGLWIVPLILIWDEMRKWIARKYPDGFVAKYTNF